MNHRNSIWWFVFFLMGMALLIGINEYQATLNTQFNLTETIGDEKIDLEIYTPLDKRLQSIIKEANTRGITIYYIKSDKVNAFTNGKDIYLYAGLLDKLTPNAIYITITHEMGHIVKDHLTRHNEIIDKYLANCILEHEPYICAILISSDKEMLKASRGFEYEADMYAFTRAKAEDIPMSACNELFSNLKSHSISDLQSTHPATHKRLKQCEEYIKDGTEAYFPTYETLRAQELITF